MRDELNGHEDTRPTAIERIAAPSVEYLCFEGGGGKGIVFLGALVELNRRGVLRYAGHRLDPDGQIKGIAGSSAGALTAVLLSCGFRPADFQRLLFGGYDFNRFFDQPAHPAPIPALVGRSTDDHAAWTSRVLPGPLSYPLNAVLRRSAGIGAPTDTLLRKLGSPRLLHYLFNIYRHWGIFSGIAAHELFRALIARKVAAQQGRARRPEDGDITFAEHRRIFRCDLVLTGSNFSTGKTGFFSADTSPKMPVAAAARISMSIPVAFKPVRIDSATAQTFAAPAGHPRNLSARALQGVWVDGGYMNNLPRTAFAHRRGALAKTLSFALHDYGGRPRRIRNFAQFLGAYAQHAAFGTGESQSSRSTGALEDIVPLIAGDRAFQIDTLDFAFPATALPSVMRIVTAAQQRTSDYFNGVAIPDP
ncbi:patatin-like phospholipase family protein [Maribius pontilimi]|uniref:Patatin-like phospholipase family protein n=1 Tax=Palleronia pontilimi TaxID=1964209 RepID=A0A934MHV7_9RHOB|nr:patatin-like phospholipase family protein [Palleronia pontilimi]MBJ3763669.1 patatin-like phospholipase family protein [Palleronia pontilimi]